MKPTRAQTFRSTQALLHLAVLGLFAGCAQSAPMGSESLPVSNVEDEMQFQRDYCEQYGCPELEAGRGDAPGEIQEWLSVSEGGAIHCGSQVEIPGNATVADVVALLESDWSTWWPNSRVRERTQSNGVTRFAFNPLYAVGVAPTRVVVEQSRASADAYYPYTTVLKIHLSGDFEGDARFAVERVEGGVVVTSEWDGVHAQGLFSLRPSFFAWLHLRREAAGLRGLVSKLRD